MNTELKSYFLDACALIAVYVNESGADNVKKIIQESIDGKNILKMHQVNLLEVYSHLYGNYGRDAANTALDKIKLLPIQIINELDEKVFKLAGRLKPQYTLSFGDSVVAAECIINNNTLITGDHKDFEPIKKNENIKINWFR
jgi:predicted nucleic acid-binding protein